MVVKKVKASNVQDAQKALGQQQVVSTGNGEYTTPESLAANSQPQTYTIGGQTFTDPKQYEAAKALSGFPTKSSGAVTPEAQQAAQNAVNLDNQAIVQRQTEQQMALQAQQDKINQENMAAAEQNNNIPSFEQMKQNAEQNNPLLLSTKIQETTMKAAENSSNLDKNPLTANPLVQLASNAVIVAPTAASIVYSIFDNIRALTSVGGRDTARVQDARNIYGKMKNSINQLIPELEQGKVDVSETMDMMNKALEANALIQKNAHEKGLENFAYWLKGGQDLEAEGIDNEIELRRLRDQIILAAANGQAFNRAKLNSRILQNA